MRGTLSESEIDDLLASEAFGHLGCCEDGKPYVVPMAYAYHDNVFYGQTTEGKKTDILRKNPAVCFQVQRFASGRWESAQCHGRFEEMAFGELRTPEQIALVKLLTERIGAIQGNVGISVPFSFENGAKPGAADNKPSTLFRIVVAEKTGMYAKP